MSGICGVVVSAAHLHEGRGQARPSERADASVIGSQLRAGAEAQAHRGPDGGDTAVLRVGEWGVGLAHQRLEVMDRTAPARQPLAGPGGEDVCVFAGELYNYRELRRRLGARGVVFSGSGDAEVAAAALREWGVERALEAFNGSWAFAWLDGPGRRLVLARDRLGLKPLYLDARGARVAFASEIKALLAMSGDRYSLHAPSVRRFLTGSLLDVGPATLFAGIRSVEPGTYVELDLGTESLEPRPVLYWTPPVTGSAPPTSEEQLRDDVRALFHDAVRLRLRTDAPVGVLLSGSVDSSAVAAAVAANAGGREVTLLHADHGSNGSAPPFDASGRPLPAGTNGRRSGHDAAVREHARAVARHLKLDLWAVPLDLTAGSVFDLLERATWHHDEPLPGLGSVAQFRFMQAAREMGMAVVLSSRGADQLLGIGDAHVMHQALRLARAGRVHEAAAGLATALRSGALLPQVPPPLPLLVRGGDGRAYGLGPALLDPLDDEPAARPGMTLQERRALDLRSLVLPREAHQDDRMSMAHGRSLRFPFLDYRLVERILPLTPASRLRHGWTKFLFRQALEQDLPAELASHTPPRRLDVPRQDQLIRELEPRLLAHMSEGALVFRHGLLEHDAFHAAFRRFATLGSRRGGVPFRRVFNPLALELWLRRFHPHLQL